MPYIGTDNELQLIALVKKGDRAALRTLYSTYVRYLAAICSRYIGNSEDVRDVLQDCFLKIFSEIASFEYRGKGSLKGWMARITVNAALKFLQKSGRIEFVEISEKEYALTDDGPDIDAIPPEVLFDMIRRLPDGYRTIFNLYVIENRSHREIAALLNIRESTSASQLHRAKALLADNIRQYNNR